MPRCKAGDVAIVIRDPIGLGLLSRVVDVVGQAPKYLHGNYVPPKEGDTIWEIKAHDADDPLPCLFTRMVHITSPLGEVNLPLGMKASTMPSIAYPDSYLQPLPGPQTLQDIDTDTNITKPTELESV